MTDVETTTDDYNRTAIEIGQAIHEHRKAAHGDRVARDPDPDVATLFPDYNLAGLGVALEFQRMGGQPVSDALQAEADDLGFTLEHLGVTIGTVIVGISLRDATDDEIGFARRCLLERKVVFFRDQHLGEDEQVTLGRRFGELDAFPFGPPGENPYILEILHDRLHPGTENGWHTDVTWMQRPSLGSIAQLIKAPPAGGATLFADSHAAYLGLPARVQQTLEKVEGINDYRIFVMPGGRNVMPDSLVEEIKARIPFGVSHPLARTHPETGKTALYLNQAFLRAESLYDVVSGEPLGEEESTRLVAFLGQQHARPEYHCRFDWTPGDLAFWDNRAVQHYATCDYWPHERILRRVTLRGDEPYFDPDGRPRGG